MVIILVRPPARVVSTHKCSNKKQYTKLLDIAHQKQLLLYHTTIEIDNGVPVPSLPWKLDEDSVTQDIIDSLIDKHYDQICDKSIKSDKIDESTDDINEAVGSRNESNELKCEYCGKLFTSKSGKTLHIKSKHGEAK